MVAFYNGITALVYERRATDIMLVFDRHARYLTMSCTIFLSLICRDMDLTDGPVGG